MTLPQTVRIRHIRDETRTTRTFILDAEAPEAEPGQFVMLWLPGVDEKLFMSGGAKCLADRGGFDKLGSCANDGEYFHILSEIELI